MMKLFYVLVIVIVLFFGLTFTYMNNNPIQLNYFSLQKEVNLAVLLLVTLIFGAIAGYFVNLLSSLRMRRNLSKLKKELSNLKSPNA